MTTENTLTVEGLRALGTADRAALKEAVAGVPRADLATLLSTVEGGEALRMAFGKMPGYYTGEQLQPPAVARWRIRRDQAETLEYDLQLGGTSCTVAPAEKSVTPAVTMTMDAVSFIEMASGLKAGMELLTQGRLEVEGDVNLAVRMESLFGLGAQSA